MKKYIGLSVALFLFPFQGLLAQVDNIHLSFDSGAKKDRVITVTWTSQQPYKGVIWYGTDSTKLALKVIVDPKQIAGQNNSFVYKAELKNLFPEKRYYYKCTIGDEEHLSNSYSYSFTTPPKKGAKGEYMIGVWGDTQNNEGNKSFEVTNKIVTRLIKYPLNFTIHTGDIVENGSVANSWNGFLHTAQPLNANIPFMPSTGNHDVVNASQDSNFQKPFPIFYDLFNLPEDELNYSFDYGNIHFVAISSGYCQGAAKIDKVLFKKDSPEYKWLENDLEKARKDKKIEWVILYDHYPVHSFGVSLVPEWKSQITPIIDKYKIDLVLSGHRHVYERHKAIRDNAIQDQKELHVYTKPQGTVFITNGSSGGSLQGIGGSKMPSMLYTSAQKMYTYAIMTIRNKQLSYDVYNDLGEKIDYFKIIK